MTTDYAPRTTLKVLFAADAVEVIAERMRNLLTGREFTTVTCYIDTPEVFPTVHTGLRLHQAVTNPVETTAKAPFDDFGTVVPGRWTLTAYFGPLMEMLDLSTIYVDQDAALAGSRNGQHITDGADTVTVEIQDGRNPRDVTANSVINVHITNRYGASKKIVVKPRYFSPEERIEGEAEFFDRLATMLDSDQATMNGAAAAAVAERARDTRRSTFTGEYPTW